MAIFEKWKERFTFPVKLYYLKLLFFIIVFVGIAFIQKDQLGAMQAFAGVLLGVLTFFIATAVLAGFLKRLKEVSDKLKKEFDKQITISIDAERNAKKYSIKLNHLQKREFLYRLVGEIQIEKFHSAMLYGFIVLIATELLSFFEFTTGFNATSAGEVIWTLSSWHIVYALLTSGIYFTLKSVFYLYEVIRKSAD